MTTLSQNIGIDLIALSEHRPESPIPRASPVDINLARLHGLNALPSIRVMRSEAGYALLQGLLAWRAAQFLMIENVDAIVFDELDAETCKQMIKEDYATCGVAHNAMDQSNALMELSEYCGRSPHTIGRELGMARYTVSHLVRLQRLSKPVQRLISSGQLTMGKAKLLVSCRHEKQYELAMRIVRGNWSTSKTAAEIRAIREGRKAKPVHSQDKDAETRQLEARLAEVTGSPVDIRHDHVNGGGELCFSYSNLDILEGILRHILPPDDV